MFTKFNIYDRIRSKIILSYFYSIRLKIKFNFLKNNYFILEMHEKILFFRVSELKFQYCCVLVKNKINCSFFQICFFFRFDGQVVMLVTYCTSMKVLTSN